MLPISFANEKDFFAPRACAGAVLLQWFDGRKTARAGTVLMRRFPGSAGLLRCFSGCAPLGDGGMPMTKCAAILFFSARACHVSENRAKTRSAFGSGLG